LSTDQKQLAFCPQVFVSWNPVFTVAFRSRRL